MKIGQKFLFEYRCWESEESCDVDLWHRTHQPVTVIDRIELDKDSESEVGRMWRVRFDDGFVGDVFEEEILKDSSEYQRKDYMSKGRGWHNDRYRHALAARGVKTK